MSGDLFGFQAPAPQSMVWARARAAYLQEEHHFYPTPPACVTGLLAVEAFPGPIWEPACGDGAISKVLAAAGYEVVSTDLIDRGFGTGGVDFLGAERALGKTILTNPPFKLAEGFAGKAVDLGVEKVALLCRVQWLQGVERRKLFTSTPLARVWILPYRPMFRAGAKAKGMGGGMIAYAWFVWSRGHQGDPALGWL